MTIVQKKIIDSYTTLVLAGGKTIEEVPDTTITLDDESESTIRAEVEIRVAERIIEVFG
jgi:hypothetical protein